MRGVAPSLIVLAALAGCRQQQAHSPVTEAEASAIAERTEASFTTGDVNAVMRHYANGAVMIDASNAAPSTRIISANRLPRRAPTARCRPAGRKPSSA